MVIVIGILVFLLVVAIASMISGALLWLAWNAVVVGMFGGPHMGFWVAVLVMVVLNMIFGRARVTTTGS